MIGGPRHHRILPTAVANLAAASQGGTLNWNWKKAAAASRGVGRGANGKKGAPLGKEREGWGRGYGGRPDAGSGGSTTTTTAAGRGRAMGIWKPDEVRRSRTRRRDSRLPRFRDETVECGSGRGGHED
ncbi:hypothetical protein PR202_gb20263 [Eleusine coracana subsp. coracana]|uniref:Uncharacterized protein n=1 Tax=Eleusine coracana subsp. coracana TaxID=191504 RepID=A0AAV5FC40_ELECO|nr:hypothetical protein PR202_gb20263 [Eleusine coracana subsp. coracana]